MKEKKGISNLRYRYPTNIHYLTYSISIGGENTFTKHLLSIQKSFIAANGLSMGTLLKDISLRTEVGNAAFEEINSLAKQSRLERLESQVHELSWSDIQADYSMIGVGGFSRVYKIQLNLPQLDSESFALKCLNSNTMSNQESFLTGAIDLAVEGEILSRIHHENIIQLHGVSTGGPLKAYTTSEKGYFLVLDLLDVEMSPRTPTERRRCAGAATTAVAQ